MTATRQEAIDACLHLMRVKQDQAGYIQTDQGDHRRDAQHADGRVGSRPGRRRGIGSTWYDTGGRLPRRSQFVPDSSPLAINPTAKILLVESREVAWEFPLDVVVKPGGRPQALQSTDRACFIPFHKSLSGSLLEQIVIRVRYGCAEPRQKGD